MNFSYSNPASLRPFVTVGLRKGYRRQGGMKVADGVKVAH